MTTSALDCGVAVAAVAAVPAAVAAVPAAVAAVTAAVAAVAAVTAAVLAHSHRKPLSIWWIGGGVGF